MKRRLVGGLILINLCVLSLNLSAGEQDITNEDVLDQLVGLREYIDEKRDFTKESKGLKPVLVQYRSSASKIDGIAQCNLSFNTDALHLSIGGYSVQADGTPITLTINVVYEWTEYIGYTIKSAKLNATNELKLAGEQSVKPIYYHPIYLIDVDLAVQGALLIIDNNSLAYDWATLKAFIESFDEFNLCPVNLCYLTETTTINISRMYWDKANQTMYIYGMDTKNNVVVNALNFTTIWNSLFAEGHIGGITDSVNKIN